MDVWSFSSVTGNVIEYTVHVWIWMNSSPSKTLNYHTFLQF